MQLKQQKLNKNFLVALLLSQISQICYLQTANTIKIGGVPHHGGTKRWNLFSFNFSQSELSIQYSQRNRENLKESEKNQAL